jgi:hypothetical protein
MDFSLRSSFLPAALLLLMPGCEGFDMGNISLTNLLAYDIDGQWAVTMEVTWSEGIEGDQIEDAGFEKSESVDITYDASNGYTTMGDFSGYWNMNGGVLENNEDGMALMMMVQANEITGDSNPNVRGRAQGLAGTFELRDQAGNLKQSGTIYGYYEG